MDGNIFNSRGAHVAIVRGPAISDLKGKKLYDLKGINIYKPSGDLVDIWPTRRAPTSTWTKPRISCFRLTDLVNRRPENWCR